MQNTSSSLISEMDDTKCSCRRGVHEVMTVVRWGAKRAVLVMAISKTKEKAKTKNYDDDRYYYTYYYASHSP